MENDAKFYTEDPYVNAMQLELDEVKRKLKEVEIENANLKRIKDASGQELLLEEENLLDNKIEMARRQ
jgi:hypothetical protein